MQKRWLALLVVSILSVNVLAFMLYASERHKALLRVRTRDVSRTVIYHIVTQDEKVEATFVNSTSQRE